MTATPKKKKGQFSRLSSLRFALLWTLTTGIAWASMTGVSLLIDNIWWDFFSLLPEWIYVVVGGMLIGTLAGAGQQWLLRRRFGSRVRGWLRTTIAAWGAGAFSFYLFMFSFNLIDRVSFLPDMMEVTLAFCTLFIPMTLIQSFFLRKHVKRAWLWVIAAVVSSAVFALPFLNDGIYSDLAVIGTLGLSGVLQGSVMGFVMLWLWQMGAKPQDALRETDSDEAPLITSRLVDTASDHTEFSHRTADHRPRSQSTSA